MDRFPRGLFFKRAAALEAMCDRWIAQIEDELEDDDYWGLSGSKTAALYQRLECLREMKPFITDLTSAAFRLK